MVKNVNAIVDETLRREQPFFDAIKTKLATGELEFHYVVGNHDRLLVIAWCPEKQKRHAARVAFLDS